MAGSNPCLNHDCHACCVGTMMTLTNADVARIRTLGHSDFCRLTASGGLQLVNRGGRCVFLLDGVCSVYTDRPEGCQLYPLVLDTDADRAVLDDFCPHASEFTFDHADERRLRFSVATEHREATARRGRIERK